MELTCNEVAWVIIGVAVVAILVYYIFFAASYKKETKIEVSQPVQLGPVSKLSPPPQPQMTRPPGDTLPAPQVPTTAETFEMMNDPNDPPFILYVFHKPGCPACEDLGPKFNTASTYIQKMYGKDRLVDTRAFDVSDPDNGDIAFYFNVNSVPKVVLATPSYNVLYEGDRSPKSIIEFVKKHVTKCMQEQQRQ